MSGDYTRFTHDPLKRRSGVLMQQGRVQLDSDWNEFVGIAKRRQRLQSLDTFGPYGVPYKTTPDAFLIGWLGGPTPDLSITPGRLYVEGNLVEHFGSETASYLAQPFYPAPPPLPAGDAVVFLDVWEREITYVEDASLLDVALGGADTATRTQTVWQVRFDGRDAATCGMDVGEAPSAGLLSTAAILPPAPSDPCLLPPIAGYRGLENRLYRVEIHDPGGLGAARFKWSRDNGSVVSVVRALAVAGSQTTLTVNRIGRDPVLRFRIDDWVTITDDHRELMGEPGQMARVIDINETRNEIMLDRALPSPGSRAFGANPAELVARHTRIQRWDQTAATSIVDADGLIATGPGPIELEDGIEVRFDLLPAGGGFRTFDHWVFAARVADASVETLVKAPPRGIRHHYVQLAAITAGQPPAVSDCRPQPPAQDGGDEECCCSITVSVEESIQDAIDALPPEGGCVCLKAGVHKPRDTIRIRRPNVKLTGESPGTIVVLTNGQSVLRIERSIAIRVETIAFRASIESGEGVVSLAGCDDVAFLDCSMENRDSRRVVGIEVLRTDRLRVERSTIRMVEVGIRMQGYCECPIFADNVIAPGGEDHRLRPIGILSEGSSAPLTISGNRIGYCAFGVVINDTHATDAPSSTAEGSAVIDNIFVMTQYEREDANRLYAIDVAAPRATITGNRIWLHSAINVGIRVAGSQSVVVGNVITSRPDDAVAVSMPIGIQIGYEAEKNGVPTIEVVVADNRMEGAMNGVIATFARGLTIRDNALVGTREGTAFGIFLNKCQETLVSGNRVSGVSGGLFSLSGRAGRFSENDISSVKAGLALSGETGASITGNRISDTTLVGMQGSTLIGRTDIVQNRFTHCAYEAERAVGIGVKMVAGELHVEANEVTNTGMTPFNKVQPPQAIGIFGTYVLEARIESNLVTHTDMRERDREREDRALLLGGAFDGPDPEAEGESRLGFPVQILSNKFYGTGRTALVELTQEPTQDERVWSRFDRVSFHGNYCSHLTAQRFDERQATVVLVGNAATVSGNQIKAMPGRIASVNFNRMPGPFIGNVTAGGAINHVDFPAPEGNFNQIM
jgi:hypothetical protein